MTVDLIELRQWATMAVVNAAHNVVEDIQKITLLDVGVTFSTIGILLAARRLYLDWREKKAKALADAIAEAEARKGYDMVTRDLNDKAHSLLGQIINDGLFEAECAGKISNRQVLDLYKEMSEKLDLPDLVPKKHRLKIVKEQLKRMRFKKDKKTGELLGKEDYQSFKSRITPKKFAEYVGKYKFRKAA